MPSTAVVDTFVSLVEAGDFVGAIEKFYAPEASMQENDDAPRVGRDVLVEGERRIMAAFKSVTAKKVGPALVEGDRVAIRWTFEFTTPEGGRNVLDEIAWQTWRGDEIVEEKFFYDPKQLGR
jgi:hypothetical protein